MRIQTQNDIDQIVVFTLDNLIYALPVNSVLRVIHAIEIRPLPKAPDIIAGIINVKGQIIPVIDIRKRFGFPSRELDTEDQLIIADTGKRQVALLIDKVTEIQHISPQQYIDAKETIPFAGYINGVAKIMDELILIYDLEHFLNLDEEDELEQALLSKSK
jgi:purine-binding chemotaxis protein CheW